MLFKDSLSRFPVLLHYIATLPFSFIVWVYAFLGVDAFDRQALTLKSVMSFDFRWSVDYRLGHIVFPRLLVFSKLFLYLVLVFGCASY
jgi:hypothetical protein